MVQLQLKAGGIINGQLGERFPHSRRSPSSAPPVFENPLLAMVTMVTLLALSPLLALPVQTSYLTSSPNSPNFGNGDHVLTKRSIIPLIKGAADYWLRSGLD